LFDAWSFLLARRRAAVCFSGRTDCWGLFLGSTTLPMPCGERRGLWTKAKPLACTRQRLCCFLICLASSRALLDESKRLLATTES